MSEREQESIEPIKYQLKKWRELVRKHLPLTHDDRDDVAEIDRLLSSPRSPGCYVAMPKELTAENGAKGLLSGEFHETVLIGCAYCDQSGWLDADETIKCESCDGEGAMAYKAAVSWTTIKEIYAMAVKHLAT